MNLEKQDAAAVGLVNALSRNRNGLDDEARAVMLRLCGGHERRTVALLTHAEACVKRCAGDGYCVRPAVRVKDQSCPTCKHKTGNKYNEPVCRDCGPNMNYEPRDDDSPAPAHEAVTEPARDEGTKGMVRFVLLIVVLVMLAFAAAHGWIARGI